MSLRASEVPPRRRLAFLAAFLFALCALGGPAEADASSGAPHWSIVSEAEPTYFKPGDPADAYRIVIRNDGGAATSPASPVTISDSLPAALTATKIIARGAGPNGNGQPSYSLNCDLATVACSYEESSTRGPVVAGATITITITVSVSPTAQSPLSSIATVSGGGAPTASVSESTPLSQVAVPFGLAGFTSRITDPRGEAETQAGSHPFELSAYFALTIAGREATGQEAPLPAAPLRDLEAMLPAGLIGNAVDLPSCPQQAFQERENLNCPLDTQVGTVKPLFYGKGGSPVFPLFNVSPRAGQIAELGVTIAGIGHVPISLRLRENSDYGVSAQIANLSEASLLQGAQLTLWGVPAAAGHDLEREGTVGDGGLSEFCKPEVFVQSGEEERTICPSGVAPKPFLTMPTSCSGVPLSVGVQLDSWQPGLAPQASNAQLPALSGCQALSFNPSILLRPEVSRADSPSGYELDVHVPQDKDPDGLASPDLKNAVLTLPKGLVISPSVAGGLAACSPGQFALGAEAPAQCPAASQIGSAEISTPLLSAPLEGQLFLGAPECGPCGPADASAGKLAPLFLQVQGSGLTVKLAGSLTVDQSTGQLSTSFAENPQLPFEDLELRLDGGPRAPLANPRTCGTPLSALAKLTPYSSALAAEPTSPPYEVSGCQALEFKPTFLAGTLDSRAGAFSPETVTITRPDQEEEIGSIELQNPPGLLGKLAGVAICPSAQATNCPSSSQIGTVSVGLGPGLLPFYTEGGVFLTSAYKGAPFGLAISIPVLAGPFDLGQVIVRATLNLNPRTAALSIQTDPLPQSLDGIPLQIRTIHLDLGRKGFIFNPTSCARGRVTATITSTAGSSVQEQSPFQATDCAKLGFKPRLSLVLAGKTNRGAHPRLSAALSMPSGGANLKRAVITLPPTELIDNAHLKAICSSAQLAAESCPPGSVVGQATVMTPLLGKPLAGPVYLHSSTRGGLGLLLALKGQLEVAVVARIESAGDALRARFTNIPDVPISRLSVAFRGGGRGLLVNGTGLCRSSPRAAAAFEGQNGSSARIALPLHTRCSAG